MIWEYLGQAGFPLFCYILLLIVPRFAAGEHHVFLPYTAAKFSVFTLADTKFTLIQGFGEDDFMRYYDGGDDFKTLSFTDLGEYVEGQGTYGVVLQIGENKIELSGISDFHDSDADDAARMVEYDDHFELGQLAAIQNT